MIDLSVAGVPTARGAGRQRAGVHHLGGAEHAEHLGVKTLVGGVLDDGTVVGMYCTLGLVKFNPSWWTGS